MRVLILFYVNFLFLFLLFYILFIQLFTFIVILFISIRSRRHQFGKLRQHNMKFIQYHPPINVAIGMKYSKKNNEIKSN